jgi:hypothetical protein
MIIVIIIVYDYDHGKMAEWISQSWYHGAHINIKTNCYSWMESSGHMSEGFHVGVSESSFSPFGLLFVQVT